MRFKKLYIGISLFLFLLTGLTVHATIRTVTGTVTKLSDGDTIQVTTPDQTKLKVRLFGIDAPETPKINRRTGHINKPGQPIMEGTGNQNHAETGQIGHHGY